MNAILSTPIAGGIAYHHADGRALNSNDFVPAPSRVSPVEIETRACSVGCTASHPSIGATWAMTEAEAVRLVVAELAPTIAEHAVAGRDVVVVVRRAGR